MKGYGEILTKKMIVEKLMCMFTSHFNHVIVAIQESNNLAILKLKILIGSLEAHVLRIMRGKRFKILHKHCMPRHGKNIVVLSCSREEETRLRVRSIG